MGNEFIKSSFIEFGITNKNTIIVKLIKDLIQTQRDLDELRKGMSRKGHSNKIFKVLCEMRKRRIT